MQWTVIVLSSAVLVTARTRSDRKEEFGVGSFEYSKEFDNKDRQLWNPRYQKDLYELLNSMNEKSDLSVTKFLRKRALSALSRWKPLGNLGIRMKSMHRVPSRAPMVSMVPEMNLISAESSEGVRPLGQPLRWGRRR